MQTLFGQELDQVEFVPTRKDFEGDLTVVVFSMLKILKGKPEQIGNQLGAHIVAELSEVSTFNVVKGF